MLCSCFAPRGIFNSGMAEERMKWAIMSYGKQETRNQEK